MKRQKAQPKTEAVPADRKGLCNANCKNCSKCEYKYKTSDVRGPSAVCPQCGHPRPCDRAPMDNGRCDKHGGKSRAGVFHPNYTTGVNSKYLPDNLRIIVEELAAKEDLLSNLAEIQVLYARYLHLLSELSGVNFYKELIKVWTAYAKAEMMPGSNAARVGKMKEALDELGRLIRDGGGEAAKWQEIYTVLNQLMELRDAEMRKMEMDRAMIPADRAMLFVNTLSLTLRKRITEICDEPTSRKLLAAISSDLGSLLGPLPHRQFIAGPAGKQ